jgi:uncharacterized membrane protein YhaH (DUF805 family)
MPLSTTLFSFTGRLNRARFWLASILLIVVSLVLLPISALSWVLIETSPLSLLALVAVKGWSVMPTASAGLLLVSFLYLLVSFAGLLVTFASFAVATKRLHDRNKSAWWWLLFALVPLILSTIAYYTDPVEVRPILVLACLAIDIWLLVELGFLRGTAGPNRYGPDPLQIDPTGRAGASMADQGAGPVARFATVVLLSLSGAVFVAELALPIVLVQHGPWSRVLSAVSPRMPTAPNAAAESGVTGVWTAYDVGFPPWTLTLTADGDKLSGTVQQGARDSSGYSTSLTMPAAIYDGEIDGNKIIFKCQDPWVHDRTITFTGIVNGDEITFTRQVVVRPGGDPGRNGIFGASGAARFTAQRVVSSSASSAPAKPDREGESVKLRDLGEGRFVSIDISGVANSELDWLLRPPRGHVKFDEIPFTILSGDRSVIHMHNRVRPDYPSTLRFPIGAASVAWVHLLLCGDWISNPGQDVGTVRISYSDGSSRDVPLISLEDIRETWMPNFSLSGHPSSRPPEGVTWKAAYSERQMRGGMASTAFLDRLSIRTDPARTINEVSFLTNEPQTGMILIAMTLEITAKPD